MVLYSPNTQKPIGYTNILLANVQYTNCLYYYYSTLYLSPSITTYTRLHPGYRIYDIEGSYNGSTRLTLDHYTYTMNITEANLNNKPKWILEYSAKVCIVVVIVIIVIIIVYCLLLLLLLLLLFIYSLLIICRH